MSGDPRFAAPATGDLRLLASSPLIDRGDPAFATPGETDLLGRARSLDGNGDCSARPDPGAYELSSICKAAPPAAAPPTLSNVRLSRTRFTSRKPRSPRRKRGTTLRFTLSEPARVSLLFERRQAGRRVAAGAKRRCVKPRRSNRGKPACVRNVRVGRRSVTGRQGANAVGLSGKLRGRPLKPGRYRLTLVATDPGGSRSKPVTRRFRILAP